MKRTGFLGWLAVIVTVIVAGWLVYLTNTQGIDAGAQRAGLSQSAAITSDSASDTNQASASSGGQISGTQSGADESDPTQDRASRREAFKNEAMRLWHEEYNQCLSRSDVCQCVTGVLKKYLDLRDRMIAAGDEDMVDFWVGYYYKRIRETAVAYGCDVSDAPNYQELTGTSAPFSSEDLIDMTLPRSPWADCQTALDDANRIIARHSDAEYEAAYKALGDLLQERDRLSDILYNNAESTPQEKAAARWQLLALEEQIKDAQARLATAKARIFEKYNQCVAEQKKSGKTALDGAIEQLNDLFNGYFQGSGSGAQVSDDTPVSAPEEDAPQEEATASPGGNWFTNIIKSISNFFRNLFS